MSIMVMRRIELLFDYNKMGEEDIEMAALSELDDKSLGITRCCVCNKEVPPDIILTVHSETGDIFCLCKEHLKRSYYSEAEIALPNA